jgi:ArsR family transcriptional regulator
MTSSEVQETRAAGCCESAAPAGAACCPPQDAAQAAWLTRVAKALSDPIRLNMLDVMAQGRACCGLPEPSARGVPGKVDPTGICVCDFQDHFGLGQSKASYHLHVLREAGLVHEEVRGKWTFYSVDAAAARRALDAFAELMRV